MTDAREVSLRGVVLYFGQLPQVVEWTIDGRVAGPRLTTDVEGVAAARAALGAYVRSSCQIHDEAIFTRLERAQAFCTFTCEPSLERAVVVEHVWAWARELDALVYLDGALSTSRGERLATPSAAVPSKDAGAPSGPPDALRVADRARVLCALGYRALLDRESDADASTRLEDLRAWLIRSGVMDELEASEEETLFGPDLGELSPQQRLDAMWRFEGAVVLAWSLGVIALPPHDQVVGTRALIGALGLLAPTPEPLEEPVLRDADEIFAMRERIFSIHWRLVDFRVSPRALDFAEVARRSTFGLVSDAEMLVDGDLAIDGVAIAQAPERPVGRADSIARERHQAANWLVGDLYGPTYSLVGTDT